MTALSPQIQAVLALFEGPLSEVRFADIDAQSLQRLADEVVAAGAEVERHEAALAGARQTLADRQEQLLAHAQRALAYARVYAENDEALTARLATLHLPRPVKRAKAEKAERAERAADDASVNTVPTTSAPTTSEAADAVDSARDRTSSDAPVPARRGKRRETTRMVALDEGAMEGS